MSRFCLLVQQDLLCVEIPIAVSSFPYVFSDVIFLCGSAGSGVGANAISMPSSSRYCRRLNAQKFSVPDQPSLYGDLKPGL